MSDHEAFLSAFDQLPRGAYGGTDEGKRYRIAKSELVSGRSQKLEAEELGGTSGEVQERAVDVQITRLRRKIERDPKNPRYLQTVRGSGYMLTPD